MRTAVINDFVAFRNIYSGSLRDISFTVSHDGGQTFAPSVRVSEDHWMLEGCPDDGPTMALDRDGVVHLVWPTLVQSQQPAIGLFHASTRDGVTFTARQRIETLGTPKPSHPQLVADACGSLTLVWHETQGSTRRAMMRQLKPLPSGDVRVGELHVVSGPHSAVYPVVAPTLTAVVAAWTDIDRSNADRSDIALRRIPLNASCDVPADAAQVTSTGSKTSGSVHDNESGRRLSAAGLNGPSAVDAGSNRNASSPSIKGILGSEGLGAREIAASDRTTSRGLTQFFAMIFFGGR